MLRATRFAASVGALVLTCGGASCSVTRETNNAPTFDEAVAPLLAARCATCHGEAAPAAGFRVASYLEAIACTTDGRPVTVVAAGGAPIVSVLDDATHAALLSSSERALIVDWVAGGAPKFSGTAHAPSFVDPRSPQSHGRALRAAQWRPMLDPNDAQACGRCHDGAPTRPAGVTSGAPEAPACTTCHQEPGGALGCNTCHGAGSGEGAFAVTRERSYPPRDACFFPGDAPIAATHAAHVDGDATHAKGLTCSTCHPIPGNPVIGGTHGNGTIDVLLDPALSGPSATFDATTKACATTCHARPGAARPAVAWTEQTPVKCGDCHASPPANHFAGSCTGCHREVNATGTGFVASSVLHINGHVDLGDGTNACGACHGQGVDPWPSTDAHPGHKNPANAAAAPCASCHVVPTEFGIGTSHPRGGPATVTFSGLAVARGTNANYAGGSCQAVYCHGAGLEGTTSATAPAWQDTTGSARTCGACHSLPPAAPHPASPACDFCHRDALVTAAGPSIDPKLTSFHINGVVDRGGL